MAFFATRINEFEKIYGAQGEKRISVGDNGECVDLVKKEVAPLQNVSAHDSWKRGKRVKGNPHIVRGTAIALFDDNGDYVSLHGKAHAAIYWSQDEKGITVYHQYRWKKERLRRPVHRAKLIFGDTNPEMNGDNYYIVELKKDPFPDDFSR